MSRFPINRKFQIIRMIMWVCDPTFLDSEVKFIRSSLHKLAYPDHILNKAYYKARRSFYSTRRDRSSNQEPNQRISLPYVPCLEAQSSTSKLLDSKIVFKYNNKLLNNLSKNNDKSSFEGGVYKIPCLDCDRFYVGETGRTLPLRITEHKRDTVNNKPESVIASHVHHYDHEMNYDESSLIFKSKSLKKRHIVESAFICLNSENTLNNNLGFSPHNKLLSRFIGSIINPIT